MSRSGEPKQVARPSAGLSTMCTYSVIQIPLSISSMVKLDSRNFITFHMSANISLACLYDH